MLSILPFSQFALRALSFLEIAMFGRQFSSHQRRSQSCRTNIHEVPERNDPTDPESQGDAKREAESIAQSVTTVLSTDNDAD